MGLCVSRTRAVYQNLPLEDLHGEMSEKTSKANNKDKRWMVISIILFLLLGAQSIFLLSFTKYGQRVVNRKRRLLAPECLGLPSYFEVFRTKPSYSADRADLFLQ
jgi:hypothetical protein